MEARIEGVEGKFDFLRKHGSLKHVKTGLPGREEPMGKARDHLAKLSELSEKIMVLGKSLNRAEKDMESTWVDQIEMRDLRDVKRHLKEVEDALCLLQEEVSHIESRHCKEA
jgi:hypothetical protein